MSTENKNEKAGAKASATPSKVEGSQDIFNSQSAGDKEKDALIQSLQDDNAALKAQASKSAELQSHIDGLKNELQSSKELLASRETDIATLKDENATLKEDNTSLKANVSQLEGKGGESKIEKAEKRFIVINSFRSNSDSDKGKIYDINTDVTDFDSERLKGLVDRNLVKEV